MMLQSDNQAIITRTCHKCNITYRGPLSDNFYSNHGYYRYTCKKCYREHTKKRYHNDPEFYEKVSAYSRERLKNPEFRENMATRNRERYNNDQEYREKKRLSMRRYDNEHREQRREYYEKKERYPPHKQTLFKIPI